MANQPAAHKQAVTWRLHRDLVAAVQAAAAANGEPVLALVTRALQRELGRDALREIETRALNWLKDTALAHPESPEALIHDAMREVLDGEGAPTRRNLS